VREAQGALAWRRLPVPGAEGSGGAHG
jgi:hypothetical protein